MSTTTRQNPLEELADRVIAETALRLSQMQTELAESVGGVLLRGARPVPLAAGRRVTSVAGAVVGLSVRETAGAAAAVVLRDGDAAGPIVATVNLAANGSWTGPLAQLGGVFFGAGLYVDVPAGAVEGAVYLRGTD